MPPCVSLPHGVAFSLFLGSVNTTYYLQRSWLLVCWPCHWNLYFKTIPHCFDYCNLKISWGTSLVVQWLRLRDPNAGGTGSIPGRGTKTLIYQTVWPKKKKKVWNIWCYESYILFLPQVCLDYVGPLHFHINFRISLSIAIRKNLVSYWIYRSIWGEFIPVQYCFLQAMNRVFSSIYLGIFYALSVRFCAFLYRSHVLPFTIFLDI